MTIAKLLIVFALVAFVSAASVDTREAFETEDAYYIPISSAEAESLGLPQLDAIGSRQKREVSVGAFETEEAYYIPISDEEAAEALRLPRNADSELYYVPEFEGGEAKLGELERPKRQLNQRPRFDFSPKPQPPKHTLNIQGAGSPKQGFSIGAQGTAQLWESQNRRNQLHANAQYSQHLGGPYGNSRPNVGGGLTLIHRF